MQENILAVLNIGSHNINVVTVSSNQQKLVPLSYGSVPALGIKKGEVIDGEACAVAIRAAIEQAEETVRGKINAVYMGISGCDIRSKNLNAAINISDSPKKISQKNIQALFIQCRNQIDVNQLQLIHFIPRGYAVDDVWGIDNPIGLMGKKLTIDAHLVYCCSTSLERTIEAVHLAKLKIKGIFFSSIILADEFLEMSEKELGTLFLDIGGTTSGFCWFVMGKPCLTLSLPIGSDHLSGDLAIGLRTSNTIGEQIKIECGLNLPSEKELIIKLSQNEEKRFNTKLINQIISARMNELIDLINLSIETYGRGSYPSKIVLAGAGAKLKGLEKYLEANLNLKVRVPNFEGDQTLFRETSIDVLFFVTKHLLNDTLVSCGGDQFLGKIRKGIKKIIHK